MSQLSIIIAVVVILVLIIFMMIGIFNKFVKNRNLVQDAWGNIDVALKRRYDLIPNLVETVKGYASHEKGHFGKGNSGPKRCYVSTFRRYCWSDKS